jgi:hypothetical protein
MIIISVIVSAEKRQRLFVEMVNWNSEKLVIIVRLMLRLMDEVV